MIMKLKQSVILYGTDMGRDIQTVNLFTYCTEEAHLGEKFMKKGKIILSLNFIRKCIIRH